MFASEDDLVEVLRIPFVARLVENAVERYAARGPVDRAVARAAGLHLLAEAVLRKMDRGWSAASVKQLLYDYELNVPRLTCEAVDVYAAEYLTGPQKEEFARELDAWRAAEPQRQEERRAARAARAREYDRAKRAARQRVLAASATAYDGPVVANALRGVPRKARRYSFDGEREGRLDADDGGELNFE